MSEELRVVYESPSYAECTERSLVLSAREIPHELVRENGMCLLAVPPAFESLAAREIRQYEIENPPRRRRWRQGHSSHDALPGVVAYGLVIAAVAWLAGNAALGWDWLGSGRVDGNLIRSGEWWRTITALTLHADLEHLAGNLVFGVLFGLFAGRLLGPGVAWLAILVAGGLGNLSNVLLLDASHRSIGASTAVFAALGLVAGYVWRAKLLSQERWPYRIGPIVGGLALLMYTGTGDENTDIGAHLMGFLSGFAGGVFMTALKPYLESRAVQLGAGAGAFLLLVLAWLVALAGDAPSIR